MESYIEKIEYCVKHERFDKAIVLALLLPENITKKIFSGASSFDRNSNWFNEYFSKKSIPTVSIDASDFHALQISYVDKGITDLRGCGTGSSIAHILFSFSDFKGGTAIMIGPGGEKIVSFHALVFIEIIIEGCNKLWKKLDIKQKNSIKDDLMFTLRCIDNQGDVLTKFFDYVSINIPIIPGIIKVDLSKILKRKKLIWF